MKALLLLLYASLSAFAEDPRVTRLLVEGDLQENAQQSTAALASFRTAEQIEPKNVGVLLRIAKQYSSQVAENAASANARHLADEALAYSQRAVAVDPTNAKAHLSVAVSYGRLTEFASGKAKLDYSKLVLEEVLKSLELDPTDDFGWHVLGRWNYGVANVSGLLRVMAGVVYGGLPKASNEDAAKYLKKAISIAPQRIIHHVELAHVYKALGKSDLEAKEWQTVQELPTVSQEDEKAKKEARLALGVPAPSRQATRKLSGL